MLNLIFFVGLFLHEDILRNPSHPYNLTWPASLPWLVIRVSTPNASLEAPRKARQRLTRSPSKTLLGFCPIPQDRKSKFGCRPDTCTVSLAGLEAFPQ